MFKNRYGAFLFSDWTGSVKFGCKFFSWNFTKCYHKTFWHWCKVLTGCTVCVLMMSVALQWHRKEGRIESLAVDESSPLPSSVPLIKQIDCLFWGENGKGIINGRNSPWKYDTGCDTKAKVHTGMNKICIFWNVFENNYFFFYIYAYILGKNLLLLQPALCQKGL